MRMKCFLAVVVLTACDPATTSQHAEVPQGGTLSEGSEGSGGAVSSGGSASSGEHGGGQVLPQAEPPRASPEAAARVKVLFTGSEPEAPTEVLGVVDVHEPGRNEQQGIEIMRERAAAMHADAVVGVEFHRDNKDFTDLSGLAVRYNDLLRNRKYDTIGVIRVHEGEGKDGDAMGELRRRATAMNADLILDVEWHDNDAEKDGTYLSGTAIRYRKD
jgi:uncharacterized protein YbjQ (UPF0145 family)